jgi:hypothetical protein
MVITEPRDYLVQFMYFENTLHIVHEATNSANNMASPSAR